MKCYRIYARFVNKVWSQVVDILDKALAYNAGSVTSAQLYKQLVSGNQSLWIGADDDGVIQCAGTTEVVDYPNKKVMRKTKGKVDPNRMIASLDLMTPLQLMQALEQTSEITQTFYNDLSLTQIMKGGKIEEKVN